MVFHVIDKRHLELDDLAQGNKLSLITIIFHGFEQKVESLESGKWHWYNEQSTRCAKLIIAHRKPGWEIKILKNR